MKNRPIVLVLILAVAAVAVFLLRGRGGPDSAPVVPPRPPMADRPVSPDSTSQRTPPRPGTSNRPLSGPPEEQEFKFDDRKPLVDQVRPLLEAVEFFDAPVLKACRARAAEVAPAVVVLLKDASTTSNMREMGLALLKDLKVASTLPAILEAASRDPDASVRADAIKALEAFPGGARAAEVRALFDGARTTEEKVAAVQVLGNLGDPASLPFLEETAKSYPDADVLREAGQAAQKTRIQSSPRRDVELVQILHQEGHALREWSLNRIVGEKKPEMAHHLRQVLDAERKLPKPRANVSFQYHLLLGLRELGQELSPEEKAFVDTYGLPPKD